ncbi:hypothetical protein A2773_04665 [Candidatus Gottesmanbacteria bacterium RIFCSPHIGHO2_01_FULL_39_10]|uniref:DUF3566 domain-containing protein n=1 Tax=Candidatus Gottesmanbacteria bacterium RIFCSPHIGHO2_01_FULL_39_10 TaxID=1798375 RepID=A0A1F5ZS34_9BACT|nr:MAG: hypothetical protein A2773_04665 [Candidatus Gottesmanbacteria bacterium RIFCSPHIGHO2_01_FULL_39_10]
MKKIKKVNPVSIAKLLAVIYGFLGLIVGAFTTLGSLLGLGAAGKNMVFGLVLGGASIIVMPLLYAVMGFIGGFIGGLLYNFAVKYTGGLEVEIE